MRPAVIAALALLAGPATAVGSLGAAPATAPEALSRSVTEAPPLTAILVVAAGGIGIFLLLRLWRLPKRGSLPLGGPANGERGGGAAVLLAMLGAALLLQPIGGALGAQAAGGVPAEDAGASASGVASEAYSRALAFAMAGALIAQAPIVALVLLASRRSGERMRWPEAALLGAATALVAFPVVAATAIAASALHERLTGVPTDVIAHDTLRLIVQSPSAWTTVISLLAVLGAPVAEEALYRGLGHGFLASIGAGPWTRIVVVAAFFALAHWASVPPPALMALFVLGVAFGWVRERSGTLLAPIVAHALFNGANVLLAT